MCPDAEGSVTYDDGRALVEDLQRLLADTTLSDHACETSDGVLLALHSPILRARSPFFEAALRAPWRPSPENPLFLPYDSHVLSDVLEFLVTGCVRVDDVLKLGLTAHILAAYELADLCAMHLVDTRAVDALATADGPLPLPIHDALREIALQVPMQSVVMAPRTAVLLLAEAHEVGELQRREPDAIECVISACAPIARTILPECTAEEMNSIFALLCSATPEQFAREVEPLRLVPQSVLEKHR